MLSQIVYDVHVVRFYPLYIHVTEALVVCKLDPTKVAFTNLTLNDYFWTISLDMLEQLCPNHVLEFFVVTNVTTKLWTFIYCMMLQVKHGLPDNDFATILPALVGELAEINAITKNLIDWLQEVAALLAIWAANVVAWCCLWSLNSILFGLHFGCVLFPLCWRHLVKLLFRKLVHLRVSIIIFVVGTILSKKLFLTVLAEKLIAFLAFHWLEWEVHAHHALDFFNHLSLQFVCNHWHFNVKSWNWLRSHDLFDSLVRDQKSKLLTFAVEFVTAGGWI